MGTPYFASQINLIENNHQPSIYHTNNSAAFRYWFRSLYQRLSSQIDFTQFPFEKNTIPIFKYCLFGNGFLSVSENEQYGLFFQPCTLSGYDFYYRPTDAIISNPMLNRTYKIGVECEIVQLTSDYCGLFDIVGYFAAQLAELDVDLKIAIANDKCPIIYGAENKNIAESIKKILDKINRGDASVVANNLIDFSKSDSGDGSNVLKMFERQNSGHGVYDSVEKTLKNMQTVINNFDAEIGIPTVPYQKKERMVETEADSKQYDSISRLYTWIDNLNNSFELVNKHYGTNLLAVMNVKKEVE